MTSTDISPVKKWVMRQYWRMQQSQSIISMGLLGSSLTLLLWPYVSWRFSKSCDSGLCFSNSLLGIPSTYLGLLSIFFSLVLIVLCIGYLYDRVFSLWTAQRSVDFERNPFWTYAVSPMFMMNMALTAENLKRNSEDDPEMQEQMDWILKYCRANANNEMWARTVQHWDKHVSETPNFWFLDEEIMSKARSQKIEDDN
ncbi:MAG: hypothetical protein HOE76_03910 [Euryarchaeota archaeon]|nr:hypothetical protein [Euryarchaeota archaeon]MBT4982804.1 hypothetical protein [Euryarchaeota archaeon]MBT5183613.1 hypothetical protein [Euryarchaeota archaeon]